MAAVSCVSDLLIVCNFRSDLTWQHYRTRGCHLEPAAAAHRIVGRYLAL